MEIGAVGSGPANRLDSLVPPTPPVNPLPAAAPQSSGSGQTIDRIAGTLQDLAGPQIGQLLNLLEHSRVNQDPLLLEGLLKTAVSSVHAHKLPEAIHTLQNLIALSPDLGPHMVRGEVGLQPIHFEVKDLMHRLTMGAKADAERTLVLAQITMQTAPNRIVEPSGVPAQDLMGLARRFFDSGEYLNYIRATEIGKMVLTQYPSSVGRKVVGASRLAIWWKRAPLAVLLLGWLLLGLFAWLVGQLAGPGSIGSGAVEVWITGFLGLVLFQFFWSIRNFR